MNYQRTLLALFSLLLPLSLAAKDTPNAILSSLPAKLAGYERRHTDDYGEPGRGQSAFYRAQSRYITVYIYDLNEPHIADGIEDPFIQKAYIMAKDEILTTQQTGYYSGVELLEDGKFSPREGTTILRARYHFSIQSSPDDRKVYAEVHLFGARDHLVKLRYVCPRDEEERSKPMIDAFVLALLEKLAKP